MSERLTMPCGCPHARKISDDLKWGKHLGGTHDDHVGVQHVSAMHHARHNHERIPDGVPPMGIGKVHEGQKPAILKK
jgi:hypothetical protein